MFFLPWFVLCRIENKDERYVDIKKVAGIPNMVRDHFFWFYIERHQNLKDQ